MAKNIERDREIVDEITSESTNISSELKEKIDDFLEENEVDPETKKKLYENLSQIEKNNNIIEENLDNKL